AIHSTRWPGSPANLPAASGHCALATSCSPERSARWCRGTQGTLLRPISPGLAPYRRGSPEQIKGHQMKLVRFGNPGAEKPGLVDDQGRLRDLSNVIADLTPANLSHTALRKIAAIAP